MRASLVAALVGGALMAVATASAVSDAWGDARFHPFTMPGNTGCVRWVDASEGTTYNCDPVNLVFPNQSWQSVRDRLRAKGWTTLGFGSTQYLHFADVTRRVPQSVHLFRSDGWARQYHVRLWQTGTTTVGGVHHESGLFQHTIDRSWEASESFVRGQLCTTACSSAELPNQRAMQQTIAGSGDASLWRGWTNDDVAAVIP